MLFRSFEDQLPELIEGIEKDIHQGELIIVNSHSIKEKIVALEALVMHVEMMHRWEHEYMEEFIDEVAKELVALGIFLDKGKKEFKDLVILAQATKKEGEKWIIHHKRITYKNIEKFKKTSKKELKLLKQHVVRLRELLAKGESLSKENVGEEDEVYQSLKTSLNLLLTYEKLLENVK